LDIDGFLGIDLDIDGFLEIFVKKEISVKDGRRSVPVKVYECPKCDAEGRNNGTFTKPINFVAHLIQDCPDFVKYLKDLKIFSFLKEGDLNVILKDILRQIQGLVTPLGVTP